MQMPYVRTAAQQCSSHPQYWVQNHNVCATHTHTYATAEQSSAAQAWLEACAITLYQCVTVQYRVSCI
jgi:hypothetical protein